MITPWNFPSAMITRKVAPALAAGCPQSLNQQSKHRCQLAALIYLAEKAGIPKGVINLIL